ncbi:hypothetical protein ACCO45_003588 [Purpureocillium lilacinum]|uniref:Uncharacterized protein n=1 Tax=Purpureocillium lilacinum TaxID=33203 RepID=A0ACC4E0A7_PURLI
MVQSSADSAPLASQTASTYAEASAIEQARKSPGLKRGARRALETLVTTRCKGTSSRVCSTYSLRNKIKE